MTRRKTFHSLGRSAKATPNHFPTHALAQIDSPASISNRDVLNQYTNSVETSTSPSARRSIKAKWSGFTEPGILLTAKVPKVGSTFWLSVYYFLNENATYSSPFDIPRHTVTLQYDKEV